MSVITEPGWVRAADAHRGRLCYAADPRLCTCSCCVPCRATSDSASVRSSGSNRSAWNTSPPRSRRAATPSRSRICGSAARSSTRFAQPARRWSASPACTRSRPTTCWRWRAACARLAPGVPIVVGGHTAAAYPEPFLRGPIDAVVSTTASGRCRAGRRARRGEPLEQRPGRRHSRSARSGRARPPSNPDTFDLDDVPLPARRHVAPWRRQYACLAHRPTWLIETARGCPFRCSFCSIWQLHARSVRERSIDVGLRGLRGERRSPLHRRRSVLVSPVAQPRAGRGAAAPRHPQDVDPRAEPRRSRGPARGRCSRRGGRLPGTSTSSSGSRRRPTRAWRVWPRTRPSIRPPKAIDVARSARLRRHRQLRDRSGLDRGGLRAAVGLRRAPPAVPGRLHHPDAAAGHRLLRGDAPAAAGAAMVAVRHAPSAVGAGARAGALLRALLRDLAAVGAESARPQEPVAVAARGRPAQRRLAARARCGARST